MASVKFVLSAGSFRRYPRPGASLRGHGLLRRGPVLSDGGSGKAGTGKPCAPLQERHEQFAGSLSSGSKAQMLVIGRGLMSMPRVPLGDEPFPGLVPKIANEGFGIIRRLKQEAITIILVGWDFHLAQEAQPA